MKTTKYLIYLSLLVTIALVLSLVERNIPVPFMTPGAQLGLANLVTVVAIYSLPNKKDIVMVIVTRLLLTSIFGGSISGLMYGSMGALLSFLVMILIKAVLKDRVSMIGISAAGAVFHNIGQILVSICIVKNIGVMLYLPFLSITGIITGVFIGIAANYIMTYMNHLSMIKEVVWYK